MKQFSTFLLLFIAVQQFAFSENVEVMAHRGSGVMGLLGKYKLSKNTRNIELFQQLNKERTFDQNGGLVLNKKYIMPISIVQFDGKTIRSSCKITDYDLAKKIEEYNVAVEKIGLKSDFRKTKILWVPYEILSLDSAALKGINKKTKIKQDTIIACDYIKEPIKKIDKILNGYAFYLIAGHGGPDPGAIGISEGHVIHEHEYAYDVTIRLAKLLLEHGAAVYMLIQDADDGIRDSVYLYNSGKERLINGDSISPVQIERLKQRTDIVNAYATKNAKKYKQMLIEIHIDSRTTAQRVDIFFYHKQGSISGKKLCQTLLNTIETKYKKEQPNRIYGGKVLERDLFTLRNISIDAAFIELGNIQNPNDQQRLIQPSNRQAIAKWLYAGIIKYLKT